MADVARIEIEKDDIGWVLRVSNPGQKTQEYRCATREQAQSLADVMTGSRPGSNRPAPSRPGPNLPGLPKK